MIVNISLMCWISSEKLAFKNCKMRKGITGAVWQEMFPPTIHSLQNVFNFKVRFSKTIFHDHNHIFREYQVFQALLIYEVHEFVASWIIYARHANEPINVNKNPLTGFNGNNKRKLTHKIKPMKWRRPLLLNTISMTCVSFRQHATKFCIVEITPAKINQRLLWANSVRTLPSPRLFAPLIPVPLRPTPLPPTPSPWER